MAGRRYSIFQKKQTEFGRPPGQFHNGGKMNSVIHQFSIVAALLTRRQEELPPKLEADESLTLEVNNGVDRDKVLTLARAEAADLIFHGPVRSGKRIYRVRLIRLGHITHLGEAKLVAKEQNPRFRLLEGEASVSYMSGHPRYKDGPVAFGGSEWLHRVTRERYIAFLGHPHKGPFWSPGFAWDGSPFHENWSWAVVEDDE